MFTASALFVLKNAFGVDVYPFFNAIAVFFTVMFFGLKGFVEKIFQDIVLFAQRPFRIGDLISISGKKECVGWVTAVGYNRTKIKLMSTGQECAVPTSDLVSC